MKIGLIPVNIGSPNGQMMLGLAQLAEQVGFESIWTFEHAIVPIDYDSKYPYHESGKMGVDPDANFVDPLIALSAIAAKTETIRLGTGVNILPQANPLYVAKQAASLDFVSDGRFELGIGIGWLREEFQAAGTPFERRGARFDDYIQAMQKIWSGDVVEHKSEFLDWTGFKSKPTPVQDPFPVVIGGTKGKAFERVARFGTGWFAPTGSPDQLAPLLEELDQACEQHGRSRSEIEITSMWFPKPDDLSDVERFADLGVGRLIAPLPAIVKGNPVESLQAFGENVIAKLR